MYKQRTDTFVPRKHHADYKDKATGVQLKPEAYLHVVFYIFNFEKKKLVHTKCGLLISRLKHHVK